MFKEEIKKIDSWFKDKEDYFTYHVDNEYVLNLRDAQDFGEFLESNFPDLIGINCMIGGDSIWFYTEDLKKAKTK